MKLLLALLLPISLMSQADYTFNLKNIQSLNEDVVNVKINNPSNEAIYILKSEHSDRVKSRMYTKAIPPKSGTTVRFKLNPNSKGKVQETILLHLSDRDEPISIALNAKVFKVPKNNLQECPKFGGKYEFNSSTGVYERSDAGQFQTVSLNLEQIKKEEAEEQSLVNTNNKTIQPSRNERLPKSKREPKVNDRRNQPSLGQILFGKTESIGQPNEDSLRTELEVKDTLLSEKESEITDDGLLGEKYKPNNIVFLLDASTSMREQNKMDLLKKAMVTLLTPLRSQDFLSIVTYSGEAKVLMDPTSAINKIQIEQTINEIQADGSTQAVKGIKKAIKVAKSNFIEDGNNQILLVSDGAFDIGERNLSLRNQIKNEASKGLIISTIGIKNEKWTNKSLIEISTLGKGSFQRIKKESDTSKLLEEVKEKAVVN